MEKMQVGCCSLFSPRKDLAGVSPGTLSGGQVSSIMSFHTQDRSFPVGAQLIGAPPIYRPGAGIHGPLADNEFSHPTSAQVVILSAAKNLGPRLVRFFAALRACPE